MIRLAAAGILCWVVAAYIVLALVDTQVARDAGLMYAGVVATAVAAMRLGDSRGG